MPKKNDQMLDEEIRVRRMLDLPSQINVKRQSIELPGGERIHVNPIVKGKPLMRHFYPRVTTLHEAFKRGIQVSENGACLGWRPVGNKPYYWVTYGHVYQRAMKFGAGLISTGTPAGQEAFIGIYSQNRIGWTITEQACNMYSMIIVPLYDTLGPDACTHIINQCSIATIVCDVVKKAHTLLKNIEDTPTIRQIIVMDAFTEEDVQAAKDKNVDLLSFRVIEVTGAKDPQNLQVPTPDDIATVCYTSGTTGTPKGVILTHGNIISTTSSWMAMKGEQVVYNPDKVYVSYLPLAHVYEKFVQTVLFMHGCKIGFFRGDVKTLVDDIKVLRPTFLPLVPRLMNRMYDKIMAGIETKSSLVKRLFFMALKSKEADLKKGIIRNDSMWDPLFKKIRDSVGGRVESISTGAAPISPKILFFFRAVFGCVVIEGYGQTEGSGVSSVSLPLDTSVGHVGAILPAHEVKLDSVPEMEYFAENNQGEICFRGPAVFKGYYKEPAKTAEAIDEDGWLHSGDIGEWTPRGQLRVIDRKKHIFKLAQGEYIAPEKIETVYSRSPLVVQLFVHGESLKSCLVGIVVPDPETLPRWAESRGITGTIDTMCTNKAVKQGVLQSMIDVGKESGLKSFEQVKDIYLTNEMFSIENELLTPTLKSKRPALRKHFADPIAEMYSNLQ